MNAGHELDALIAEKVMGWVWVKHKAEVQSAAPGQRFLTSFNTANGRLFVERFCESATMDDPLEKEYNLKLPPYSTSIIAAWEVMENISQPPRRIVLVCDERGWKCEIGMETGAVVGKAETAPLAICLAALKASGHEPLSGTAEITCGSDIGKPQIIS